MECYQGNLLTLASLDPVLASAVSCAAPSTELEIFPSKRGTPSARLARPDGASITLHSRYDPLDEAAAFARAVDTEKITTYILLGFGLGYHVKALLAAARKESLIIVIERDLSLFRAALESVDLREVFASRRVFPIVAKSPPEVFKALNPHVVHIFLDATYLVHRPSVDSAPDYYSTLHKALSDYIIYGMQNVITTVSVDFLSKQNALMNLPFYTASPGIARFKNAYAGFPAIVVSAGPSLHRNVHLLASARGRAVIIAVSTVLKPLLRRSITPDFAVVLDYHPISRKYFEEAAGDESVILVVDPKASWEAVDAHRGPKAVIHNDALHHILASPPFHKGTVPAGTTVAHSAFHFAEYIGADPIIFVGQDLAHPDGITHFPGTAVHDLWAVEANRFNSLEMREWDSILRMKKSLRKITDVHGNEIYTDGQMFSYLQQFEMNFHSSTATVIDATEGGAAKKYTTTMTLADALDAYATRPLPENPRAALDTPDLASPEDASRISSTLESRLRRISTVRDFYDKTLAILRDIDSLWPDQDKIAPLLADIVQIRSEVTTFTDVNDLVREIAQAVELRKVQADRKILSERLDGLDKQKAQLQRDLEYVSGLRDAVDELEKLFSNALERYRSFDFDAKIRAPEGQGPLP